MENSDTQSLPEKCCAECGFFYGISRSPVNLDDDAIFDPDLIRVADYYSSEYSRGVSTDIITSRPYVIRVYRPRYREPMDVDPRDQIYEPQFPEVRQYTWVDTDAICCFKNKFKPIIIQHHESAGEFLPLEQRDVSNTVRKDRQDCDGFFQYHPARTPSQHVELQMELEKVQREKEFAERTIKLQENSLRLEERGEKYQRSLTRATWVLGVVTAALVFVACSQIVLQIIQLITQE